MYTSSDVLTACRIAIKKILKNTNLEVEDELKNRWLSGEVELSRVDLAVNFRLQSRGEVHKVLKQIRRQLIEQYGPTHTNQNSVCWAPQNGNKYSIVVYAKGDQMQASKRNGKSRPDYWAKLVKECESILRVEVRLRAAELRMHNLTKARNWSERVAKEIFAQYVQRLKIFNVTSGPLTQADLEDIPLRLRPVMALHKAGIDLDEVYCDRTCQRHRDKFRKMGIDLRCPNQPDTDTVMLMDYLSKARIKKAPKWMISEGIAPGRVGGITKKMAGSKAFTRSAA